MTAESLESGLGEVFKEIRTGMIQPEGGYTVVVPSSGQVAWVGFGSQIARKNRNKQIQTQLLGAAKQTAQARAEKALLSTIKGETVTGEMSANEEMSTSIRQFDEQIDEDGNATVVANEKDQYDASARGAFNQNGRSVTDGRLPPGVAIKTYTTPDKNWAYSVAIYMADMTAIAKEQAQQMANNSPVRQGSVGRYSVEPDGSFTVKDGKLIPKSMGSGRTGRGLKGF